MNMFLYIWLPVITLGVIIELLITENRKLGELICQIFTIYFHPFVFIFRDKKTVINYCTKRIVYSLSCIVFYSFMMYLVVTTMSERQFVFTTYSIVVLFVIIGLASITRGFNNMSKTQMISKDALSQEELKKMGVFDDRKEEE